MILSVFFYTLVAAQQEDFHFTPFSSASGLASSEINTIFQDARHAIWIAHKAGISRYDGYNFTNHLFAGDHRLGKSYAVAETPDAVWIGSENGLFLFNDNRLSQFPVNLLAPTVYSIANDNHNGLWIGTKNEISYLANLHSQLNNFPVPKNCGPVKFISANKNNQVFYSDGHSVFRKGKNEDELIYSSYNKRDYITGIHASGQDSIFISSQLSGFFLIANGISKNFTFSNGVGIGLSVSNNGLLYYAAEGIYSINTRTCAASLLLLLPEKYREWGSAVLQDNETNFWIGTHEELLLARHRFFHYTSLPSLNGFEELYAIHQNKDGSILFGANRGKVFRQQDPHSRPELWKKVFPLAEVFDIHPVPDYDTWFCSGYQGLSRLRNGKLQRYTVEDGLRNNSNYRFLSTAEGKLFVCGDNGISQIITGDDGSVSFKNYFHKGSGVSNLVVNSMLQLQDGYLLLGSENGLLLFKNDSLLSFGIHGDLLHAPSITDMKTDGFGNIWISTMGDGILLCRYEPGAGKLILNKKFTVTDGLSSMIYLQLLIDETNTVWAAGYKEVTSIVARPGNNYSVNSFVHSHRFAEKNYHTLRFLQDKAGSIHMATSSGLISFDPAALKSSVSVPVVRVDAIKFSSGKEYGAELPYRFGTINFHYTGIYLTDPPSVRYAYRLLGSDSGWIDAGTERTAVFQNLVPGVYTFQVKASVGNSTWSDPAAYRFKVLTPFWQRWWFIFAAAMLILASLFLFIRTRERKIRKKETEKTEMEKLKAISYQYQLEIEQVVNYFATVISKHKNIDDLLWDVTGNCISKLGFEDCVIYLTDEKRNVLEQKAAWGPKTNQENKIVNPIEILPGEGIVGSVAISGRPEIINDTQKDDRYIVDDIRRRSEISVPILSDGRVMGVIDSENSQPGFYTERHLQILTTIAALCADKINKIKAEEATRAKEIEVIKLNNDLVSSQLKALRSQMNPHFIFNSLNSIAQLVASMQNEKGLQYLNKFASLLRLILEESESNFISLQDEIKLLDLYLQLESLRFGSSFNYHINSDSSLDAADIMLPSFIIHPIVENAIWHGLMHKNGERRLEINFGRKNDVELVCIVKDNGIGVDAAKQMKQQSPIKEKRQSKGLKMVNERLEILSKEYNKPASFVIEKVSENGFTSGTKVTILLPVIYEL